MGEDKIEIFVGRDGSVDVKVVEGSGKACLATTAELIAKLGAKTNEALLPEAYVSPVKNTATVKGG